MKTVAAVASRRIIDALNNDGLDLPTLPEIAFAIRDAARDENATADGLAKIVVTDPAISARLIKLANSPMFRAPRLISDLTTAIGRLGFNYAANVAQGLAMQQLFQARTELVDGAMREIWSRSIEIAANSTVLARHYTHLGPDNASLAGLVHNIGALPILSWTEEHEGVISDNHNLSLVLNNLSGRIGARILESWDFPTEIASVPQEYNNFDRVVAETDYADVVQIAYLCCLAKHGAQATSVDWHSIGAFRRIGIDPDEDVFVSEQLSADLEAALTALG